MGFFDSILSIGTTIGKIAGALSGPPGASNSVVDFGRLATGPNPQLGQVIFYNDPSGETMVANQDPVNAVELAFPASEAALGVGPLQFGIGPSAFTPISSIFNAYANADVDEFTITSGTIGDGSSSTVGATDASFTIRAQSYQTIADGVPTTVGASIGVTLNVSNHTVTVAVLGGLTLVGIVLLNIRGAGNTVMNIYNAFRGNAGNVEDDDPASMTVTLPQGIDVSGGLTFVDVCVTANSASSRSAPQQQPLTAAHFALFDAAAAARAQKAA